MDAKRPYRQRTSAPSNSALFEKRGDPWVSQRQGLEDFGRVLRTEDPDLDSFTRARKVKERHPMGPDKPIGRKPSEPDDNLRAANINLRLKQQTRAASTTVRDPILLAKIKAMRGE